LAQIRIFLEELPYRQGWHPYCGTFPATLPEELKDRN
jgi:hypothetical protein